jgi:hypothetical protein
MTTTTTPPRSAACIFWHIARTAFFAIGLHRLGWVALDRENAARREACT